MTNSPYSYGHHRGKEVLEHITQELEEQEVDRLYKVNFWEGFSDAIMYELGKGIPEDDY